MANLDLTGIITRICTDLRAKFSKVTVERYITSGTMCAKVTVDGTSTILYAPRYTLPIASTSKLGCVKVGSGLAVDAKGVISLDVASASGVSF